MRWVPCLLFVGLLSCTTGEFWPFGRPHDGGPPAADGGSSSDGDPDRTPEDCTPLACRLGASCLEPTSYVTCRCPNELPDLCPPLAFASLLLPDNAEECWPRAMSGDGSTTCVNCCAILAWI